MAQEQNRRDLDDALRTQRRSGAITQTDNNEEYQVLSIKVITLVLLLAGSAAIDGAGTAIYINSISATADATAVLNCKPEQRPAGTFKHVDPISTGHNKGY